MPLDKHLAAMLQKLSEAGRKPAHLIPLEESRMGYFKLTRGTLTPDQVIPVASVEDINAGDHGCPVRARIYRPEVHDPVPTVVFFHGGGFVLGNLETHDNMCRELCKTCEVTVLSVDYRLAPENPFPAAVDDALAATQWALANVDRLGRSKIVAVGGDSAGGNLAAVVSQQLSAQGVVLAAQLLIYPALDHSNAKHPSRDANASGYFLDVDTFKWFEQQYVGTLDASTDPRITPINSKGLSRLPPALIVTAEFDPLRDEGEVYGNAMASAGVNSEVIRCDGMIHAFFDMGRWSPKAQDHIQNSLHRFSQILRGA